LDIQYRIKGEKVVKIIFLLISQLRDEHLSNRKNKKLFDPGELPSRLTIVNRKKYEASVRAWENAIKDDPNNELLWNNKGVSLVRLGELKEAIKSYNRALRINPMYENAWFNKGKALTKLEKHKDAVNKNSLKLYSALKKLLR
jgi:tetratricopeptide (TPR) repeat protein